MSEIYKVYLDVCCLNRPLDDLEQFRIRIEAEAVTEIIQNCEDDKFVLINSDIIEFEVNQHSDLFKQEQIRVILNLASIYIRLNKSINLRAEELMKLSFKYHDVLHLAFAEAGGADVFLTTDDRLLRKAKQYLNIFSIEIENPTIWLINISQREKKNETKRN